MNEGAVEWPPSPWRILRALVAVGFARHGWRELPALARQLLEKLASALPAMHLPPASVAHTRHFMPPYSGNTMKVFDAFAYVGAGALAVTWDVVLDVEEECLLDALLDAMPYLGRAESWVEASRVARIPPGLDVCAASESSPGPGFERVALLAPEAPRAYAYWRASVFEREMDRKRQEKTADAEKKGRAAPKTLAKKELAAIEELLPKDVVDALLAETKTLQSQGWSQPPGTRWVPYWRKAGALRPLPPSHTRGPRGHRPTMALLALASDTKHGQALPPMSDALWRMEVIHETLTRLSDSGRGVSPAISGKENGVVLRGHCHATLLPLTLDRRRGRIDHVLVYAPMGFDEGALAALTRIAKTYAKNLPAIFVTLAGLGDRDDFVNVVPIVRRARVFRTVTPFVPPRYLKKRGADTLVEQVQSELERRGFPRADTVEILPNGRAEFRKFRKIRRAADRAPPGPIGAAVRIVFSEPVFGPIALGYASHFGLGCFEPEEGDVGG